jgi:ribosomal protein L25 (general stress protein Ctc)
MATNATLNARPRQEKGKSATRKMRAEGAFLPSCTATVRTHGW